MCIRRLYKGIENFLLCEYKTQYFWGKAVGPLVSLVLLLLLDCRLIHYYINIKVSICPLMWGFGLTASKSWLKNWRYLKRAERAEKAEQYEKAKELKKLVKLKPVCDMLPTYLINYPVVLGLIYIIVNYFSVKYDLPYYLSSGILFGLGFFVDDVFHRPLGVFRP